MNGYMTDSVLKLINYIYINENRFDPITQKTPYYHMGATIVDAILQAGLNYKYVVYPRVEKLLKKYSDYKTTCDFIILTQTISLKELINWNNEQKLDRITQLSWFLFENKVENEDQLAIWLNDENNIITLSKLKGIGPKTLDYLKMLSGNQAIAIDRHLFKFLELADIFVKTYDEASWIYCKVAEKLNISKYELDKRIWTYMVKGNY